MSLTTSRAVIGLSWLAPLSIVATIANCDPAHAERRDPVELSVARDPNMPKGRADFERRAKRAAKAMCGSIRETAPRLSIGSPPSNGRIQLVRVEESPRHHCIADAMRAARAKRGELPADPER